MNHYNLHFSNEEFTTISMIANGFDGLGWRGKSLDRTDTIFLRTNNGNFLKITSNGTDLEFKFECFTLFCTPIQNVLVEHFMQLPDFLAINDAFVLLHDEWIEGPLSNEIHTIGKNPMLQNSGNLGAAPADALSICTVSWGLYLQSLHRQMIIVPDTLPCYMNIIFDENLISSVLSDSTRINFTTYFDSLTKYYAHVT